LVFPADKYSGDDVSSNEEQQEKIVQSRMAQRIEDTEANQAHRSHTSKEHAQPTQQFLEKRCVCHESAIVS